MARLMHEQGGTYAKDLNDSVTHLLICGDARDQQDLKSEDGGLNPKIAWTLEENEARQRSRTMRQQVQAGKKRRRVIEDEDDLKPDIMIVWSEWFWDCLAAHGENE
jgi:twin BRCT domain